MGGDSEPSTPNVGTLEVSSIKITSYTIYSSAIYLAITAPKDKKKIVGFK
jgi:hypothetical protein